MFLEKKCEFKKKSISFIQRFLKYKREKKEVKDMKKMLIVLLVAGLLIAGAVSAVQDVCEQITEHFDIPHDSTDSIDGSTPDGGGSGGSGSGVPG